MANLELMLEAEKRGILPPDKAALLAEARQRGLVAGSPETPKSSAMGDVLSSGLQGLKEGTEVGGMAVGGIGDLVNMGMKAMGIPTRDTSQPLPENFIFPGGMTGALLSVQPNIFPEEKPYQPQTTAGKYARTLGQFAPGLAAGPEGIVPRLASVVAPAVGSEALGQASSGTGAELPARLVGSFIGSGLAGSLQRGTASLTNALKGTKLGSAVDAAGAPTVADLKSMATENYTSLKLPENNPIIHKDALAGLRDRVKQVLSDEAFHPADEPKTARLWDRIDQLPNDHSTLTGLESVRKQAVKIGGDFATSDGRLANKVKAEISDFMSNLKDGDIIGTEATGPLQLAGPEAAQSTGPIIGVEELTKARKAWQTMKKAATIESIIDTADIRGDANYTQAGKDGALRRGFANLAVNPKKMAQFTPQEKEAIKYVAQGGLVQNAARRLGSLAVRGPVSGAATSVLGHMLGPAGPYMLAGAAEAAKAGSAGMTEANVRALQALVRGGPEAAATLSMNRRKELAKALAKYGPAAIGSAGMLTNAGATSLASE